jgi:hypothetical protein
VKKYNQTVLAAALSLLGLNITDALAQSCASVGNMNDSWLVTSQTVPFGTLTINQQIDGTLIGGFVDAVAGGTPCSGEKNSISGHMGVNGHFSFTYTQDTPLAGCYNGEMGGNVSGGGCDTATIAWENQSGASGTATLFHSPYRPTGESAPTFLGWDNGENKPTWALWQMTVTPLTYNFGGRNVVESNTPGMQGIDTCFQQGDPTTPFNGITGGIWSIAPGTNEYGPDMVGYGSGAVIYYRLRHRAPCSSTVYQTMSISSDSGVISYQNPQNYVLSSTIGRTTVGAGKTGGISQLKTWGSAQGVYNLLLR